VRIRPAHAADLGAVRELVHRAYVPYVERIGIRPGPLDDDYAERIGNGYVSVAEDPEIVGVIVLIDKSDHLLIENVAVEPNRQGEGIGRTLLALAEKRARETGRQMLRLYTNAAMTENLALYARLGYREDERRSDAGFERVFLSKDL
jgi:ribosomal protein S18 acetylase RimI-like enzyme